MNIEINSKLSKHFLWDETLRNNDLEYRYFDLSLKEWIEFFNFIVILEEFREWLGQKYGYWIQISSWFRPTYYNDIVLPSKGYISSRVSMHKKGRAIDWNFYASGIRPTDDFRNDCKQKWLYLCNKHGYNGGVGYYTWGIHLDNRDSHVAFWDRRF